MGLGDTPRELHALAGTMDDVAVQVRELGTDLVALREQIGWRSAAAEEYQTSLLDRADETTRSAALVDDVAEALRRHAEGVAETLAAIEAARGFLLGALDDARSVLGDLWDGLVDAVTPGVEEAQRIVDIVSSAPAVDVDLGWLDSARAAGWRG